ncbi:MAG TPA: hypothetical protein VGR03_14575 [Candidatus Acidoferrum sp.]|nr:hypothetical protein [Candidatus Acidoferrum sp.]
MDANQPSTKRCRFCAEEIQADAVKCRFCGQWLTEQPAPAPSAAVQPAAAAPPAAGQGVDAFQLGGAYQPQFDVNRLSPAQREAYKKNYLLETFSVGGAIALHIFTLGIFTIIYMGLKHGKLPQILSDDPSAGKAIGFLFIPFFNIYWVFFFWLRLADRVNFQFRLRGQPLPISRGLVLAAVIVSIIPYVGMISWLVLYPIVISEVLGACNQLAVANQSAGLAAR